MADALVRHPLLHGGDGVLHGHAVQEAGVHHDAGVVLECKGFLRNIAALHDFNDRQAELRGKLPVALVVARNAHNSAGAIAHKNVVRDKDGNLFLRRGVNGTDAFQPHAGLVLVELAALKIGLVRGFLAVGRHGVPVRELVFPCVEDRVLRREDHIRHAEERIAAGGVNGERVAERRTKGELRALAAADPVALLGLYAGDEVHIVQIVDQAVGVFCDGEHPLALLAADDRAAAALAHAVHNFLVRKHALAACAPVDRHGGLVRKTLFIHPQEDPLRPLVILRVGRIHDTIPVERVAEHVELLFKVGNVLLCYNGRMHMVLDGIVLRRQAEGVIADGEKNVVALHPLAAADDIHRRERTRMADMQSLSGRIRELDQAVKLRLVRAGDGAAALMLDPVFLPFLFNFCVIVLHDGMFPALSFI